MRDPDMCFRIVTTQKYSVAPRGENVESGMALPKCGLRISGFFTLPFVWRQCDGGGTGRTVDADTVEHWK
jgi:hypothetical protein